jgi:hypothetical protein
MIPAEDPYRDAPKIVLRFSKRRKSSILPKKQVAIDLADPSKQG